MERHDPRTEPESEVMTPANVVVPVIEYVSENKFQPLEEPSSDESTVSAVGCIVNEVPHS